MTGHNLEEGLFFTSPFVFTPESFKQNVISNSFPNADKNQVSDYILHTLYPDVLNGTYGYTDPIARASYIISEAMFSCNAQYLGAAFAKLGEPGGKVWSYLFAVPPALHGEDVAYTFYEGPATAVKNETLAVMMQSYFTNFVRAGDPNGEGLPAFGKYREPLDAGAGAIMEFGLKTTRMRADPLPRRRCDWWQHAWYA